MLHSMLFVQGHVGLLGIPSRKMTWRTLEACYEANFEVHVSMYRPSLPWTGLGSSLAQACCTRTCAKYECSAGWAPNPDVASFAPW